MTSDFRVGIGGSKMTPKIEGHRVKSSEKVDRGGGGVQNSRKTSDVTYGRSLWDCGMIKSTLYEIIEWQIYSTCTT